MEKILIVAIVITMLFCLAKVVEMKFIDKEMKPLKFMIRDGAIVFSAAIGALFVFTHMNGPMRSINDFMNVVTDTKTLSAAAPEVFTDEPGF